MEKVYSRVRSYGLLENNSVMNVRMDSRLKADFIKICRLRGKVMASVIIRNLMMAYVDSAWDEEDVK